MEFFSEKSLAALGEYYVYGLIDPRSDQIFYIGKGSNNRVFEHENESLKNPNSDKLKLQTIKAIKEQGLEVKKIIISYNLSENEAFAAEAALINAFNYVSKEYPLSNIVSGHHNDYVYTVEKFEAEKAAEELNDKDIKHRVIAIIINKTYKRRMSDTDIYDIVRGCWRLNKQVAQKYEYVLAIYNSLVKAVYKPTAWYYCSDRTRIPERDKNADNKINKRIYFVDDNFENGNVIDNGAEYYLEKSTKNISILSSIKGRQIPVRYIPMLIDNSSVPDCLYCRMPKQLESSIESKGICKNMKYLIDSKEKTLYSIQCTDKKPRKNLKYVMYTVDSKKMKEDGYSFYIDKEDKIIANEIPLKYIKKL
jgi:hypothetical protein